MTEPIKIYELMNYINQKSLIVCQGSDWLFDRRNGTPVHISEVLCNIEEENKLILKRRKFINKWKNKIQNFLYKKKMGQ